MPITIELSPILYKEVDQLAVERGQNISSLILSAIERMIRQEKEEPLEPSTILRLARQRSQKFDNLSRDELMDHLLDVGESMRQQAISAKTTIEDMPLHGN